MAIKVLIPAPLRSLTQKKTEVEGEGKNIRELIENLDENYPGVKERICDEKGNLRRFINIYINGQDIRFLQSEKTSLKDGDEVSIIPAIAGGEQALSLTKEDRERFNRQILILGEKGQEKLKKAKVGIIGSGGLGSPILTYLAVAGIGKIILADKDKVEISNLNRQILHWDKNIGKNKSESAEEKLKQIAPGLEIVAHSKEITEDNIERIFNDVDAVVDGLDNFPSRFLLNEFAVKKRIPLFHGAIWGFEGRVTTFIPGETACLRCLYSEAPPKEIFPVLGVTPGLIGIIQTTEVIKYFTDIGQLLLNHLLIYDGLTMSFTKIPIRKEPNCPICS